MHVADSRSALSEHIGRWKSAGLSIGLVPTMGKLHAGHLALLSACQQRAQRSVASIYVNPTQFGPAEDFDRYPRALEEDLQQLEAAGCDLVFTPGSQDIYPFGAERAMLLSVPDELGGILDGASRPGHFEGVVSVVSRLFNLVRPDIAVFGEKDYQQLAIIRRLARDLAHPVEVVGLATVREADGLAMSSRNVYLDAQSRERAAGIKRTMDEIAAGLALPQHDIAQLEEQAIAGLEQLGMEVDYVAVRRDGDLQPAGPDDRDIRILVAARIGGTRLIDNQFAIRCCNNAN